MKVNDQISDKFKMAMIPALILGVITNAYIIGVMVLVNAYHALFSPVIGAIIFLLFYFLLKGGRISAKASFLIVAYTVVIEVAIHTYFLGWDSGFYYYMFLLPSVFFLNPIWKNWIIIFFNTSIILHTLAIWFVYYGKNPAHLISIEAQSYISICNMIGVGSIIIFIMAYFRRTLFKKEKVLVEVNAELEEQNGAISIQHQHLQVLLKEVHHRVKNNLQIISSLMSLQRRKIKDEKIVEILNDSRRRIEAIALIHQKLYQDEKFNSVDFNSYLEDLVNSQQYINPALKCTVISEEVMLNLDIAMPLGLIISEMITNSIKHAYKGVSYPELTVRLSYIEDKYELIVQDNGVGLPEDFNLDNPNSLGTEIISALIQQISARIKFTNDNGAKFTIYFKN